jgi:ATP-binding cassette subfamily C (CFTR/MRP) protein 1
VLWTDNRDSLGAITIAASTLRLLDSVALIVLSFVEHRNSIRPSSLVLLYLLFSTAFDAVQCRTLWLRPSINGLHTIAAVSSASIGIKIGILFLEARHKQNYLLHPWSRSPPEALSGAISQSLYWWINTLLYRGFKASLSLETLWPTDQSMDSGRLLDRLSNNWTPRTVNAKSHALASSLIKSLLRTFGTAGIPRLLLIGLKFSQPLLLKRIVEFVGEVESTEKRNIGYGLIGATALIYLGLAVS